jgi:hypothetical protein
MIDGKQYVPIATSGARDPKAYRAQHTQRKIRGGLVEQELLNRILSMHLRRLGADELFS